MNKSSTNILEIVFENISSENQGSSSASTLSEDISDMKGASLLLTEDSNEKTFDESEEEVILSTFSNEVVMIRPKIFYENSDCL